MSIDVFVNFFNATIIFLKEYLKVLSAVRTRVIKETENSFYCRELETRKTTLELYIHVFSIKLFTYTSHTSLSLRSSKYDQGWINSRTDNIEGTSKQDESDLFILEYMEELAHTIMFCSCLSFLC